MEQKTIRMEVPYFQVPNEIFEIGLSNNEILIYIYLARCSNNSTAFPSYKTIGEKTGVSRDTAMRVMKKLETKKLIYKEHRKFVKETDDKQKVFNKSNLYYLEHDLSKFKSLGGSTQPLPLVAQNDHPSSTVPPYKELPINNYLDKELIVNRSSQKNVTLLNYKNKKEYMNDVKKYIEFDTEITDILELFYDRYLEYNNKYNHYRIDKDTFETVIENLNKMYDFVDDSYQLKGKTTFGIMVEFTNSYFEHKSKHSIKNFAEEKTLMWFLTTIYKKHTDCELFFLAGEGKGRRFKDSLSDIV